MRLTRELRPNYLLSAFDLFSGGNNKDINNREMCFIGYAGCNYLCLLAIIYAIYADSQWIIESDTFYARIKQVEVIPRFRRHIGLKKNIIESKIEGKSTWLAWNLTKKL